MTVFSVGADASTGSASVSTALGHTVGEYKNEEKIRKNRKEKKRICLTFSLCGFFLLIRLNSEQKILNRL
jgi:hypothetical protein